MEPKIPKITHDEESQSSSSAAAQFVASVDDLLIEIFLLLPMKSLGRFKSVSKHWQSLISDPGFTILRNPNPNPATGLIIQFPTAYRQNPESDPYAHIVYLDGSSNQRTRALKCIDSRPHRQTTIRSCCNELLLCGIYNNGQQHSQRCRYYVCNPTTNKYLKLPQIPDQQDRYMHPICLAFDPSKSPHYKVVVCVLVREPDHIHISTIRHQFVVYSSETGCWRISRVEPFQDANVDFECGVYWNGAMHWVSFKNTGKSIYFDPDNDRMSLEIMPTPPRVNRYGSYFGESCGHLHYIDECRIWMQRDVYELRKDYSEWFVRYRIRDPCYSYICAVVRGKSHDDSFSVLLIGGKFVRYNFLNKTRETICEVGGTPIEIYLNSVHDNLPAFLHAESLCFV